jgi:Holliday junction resolvasome RuvABC DNA-binding subunit
MQLMARTPGGSWKACQNFGIRDLLEAGRQRADVPRLALERANAALQELGFTDFNVEEIVREVSERRDYDVYTITLSSGADRYTTTVQSELT